MGCFDSLGVSQQPISIQRLISTVITHLQPTDISSKICFRVENYFENYPDNGHQRLSPEIRETFQRHGTRVNSWVSAECGGPLQWLKVGATQPVIRSAPHSDVTMKNTNFWEVTPCNSVDHCQLGGTYHRRVNQKNSQLLLDYMAS
jgi:hypothetical protein